MDGNNEKKPSVKPAAADPHLDTVKSEKHVWLMKCPPMVARYFSGTASSQRSDVSAKVTLAVDPLQPNNGPQFSMELVGPESENVPKCFTMDMSTDFVPMSVFSESTEGKLSVEGKIYEKFDLKPHNGNIELYGKLCRERTKKCMTKTRQMQVLDKDRGEHIRPFPPTIFRDQAFRSNEKKKVQPKASEMKRTRRDRGEMEDIMFKLFERQSNWTLKQLLHETDQPEQFLKDLLKDLCVYNNKGANQGSYELKPEYKKSMEESDSKPKI